MAPYCFCIVLNLGPTIHPKPHPVYQVATPESQLFPKNAHEHESGVNNPGGIRQNSTANPCIRDPPNRLIYECVCCAPAAPRAPLPPLHPTMQERRSKKIQPSVELHPNAQFAAIEAGPSLCFPNPHARFFTSTEGATAASSLSA